MQFAKYQEEVNFAPSVGDQGLKSLQLQGALPPDSLTRGYGPWTPLGASVIGSCSALAMGFNPLNCKFWLRPRGHSAGCDRACHFNRIT